MGRTSSLPDFPSGMKSGTPDSLRSDPGMQQMEDDIEDIILPNEDGTPRYSKDEIALLRQIPSTPPERADTPSGLDDDTLERLLAGDFDVELEKVIREQKELTL